MGARDQGPARPGASAVTTYYDARAHARRTARARRAGHRADRQLPRPGARPLGGENGRPEMIVLDGDGSEPLANDYGVAALHQLRQSHGPQVPDRPGPGGRAGPGSTRSSTTTSSGPRATWRRCSSWPEMPPDVSIARFVDDTRKALDGTSARLGVSILDPGAVPAGHRPGRQAARPAGRLHLTDGLSCSRARASTAWRTGSASRQSRGRALDALRAIGRASGLRRPPAGGVQLAKHHVRARRGTPRSTPRWRPAPTGICWNPSSRYDPAMLKPL